MYRSAEKLYSHHENESVSILLLMLENLTSALRAVHFVAPGSLELGDVSAFTVDK